MIAQSPRSLPNRQLPICKSIRSAKAILSEAKGFLEQLVIIAVTVWGLIHVIYVLFVKTR